MKKAFQNLITAECEYIGTIVGILLNFVITYYIMVFADLGQLVGGKKWAIGITAMVISITTRFLCRREVDKA